MFKKDFILRIIEEIARMIGKMLKLIDQNDYSGAEDLAQKGYQMLQVAPQIIGKDLISLIKYLEKNSFDYARMEALADLMKAEGDLRKAQQDPDYRNRYLVALGLYEYIDNNDKTFSFLRSEKINNLKNLL
ncbi:MAG: hypothetical protein ACNS62_18315 [Candidatus Cyclobacteriaceae bacterium M3_2C_046]